VSQSVVARFMEIAGMRKRSYSHDLQRIGDRIGWHAHSDETALFMAVEMHPTSFI
jgi:hypothetical protein